MRILSEVELIALFEEGEYGEDAIKTVGDPRSTKASWLTNYRPSQRLAEMSPLPLRRTFEPIAGREVILVILIIICYSRSTCDKE